MVIRGDFGGKQVMFVVVYQLYGKYDLVYLDE